jgi:hypothetical protein
LISYRKQAPNGHGAFFFAQKTFSLMRKEVCKDEENIINRSTCWIGDRNYGAGNQNYMQTQEAQETEEKDQGADERSRGIERKG